MRKKEERKSLKNLKAKLNPGNKTVQKSSSLSPRSTRNIKRNSAKSNENAYVKGKVSDLIKTRISNSDPSTRDAKLAPILEPEPLPSTSGIHSSDVIVCKIPETVSSNIKRKRKKSNKRQKELARLRAQKYRRYMTQEKKEQEKLKEKERYQNKKMRKVIKPISEMTEKEKRLKRKQWRINSNRYNQNKKLKLQSEKLKDSTSTTISPQMKIARKTRSRRLAKAYREIMELKTEKENLLRLVKRYEKREERQKERHLATSFSPNTKVTKMIHSHNASRWGFNG